jgi:hypothetical protein
MTEAEALKIAMRYMAPGSKFIKSATYGNLFIFQINGPDPLEGISTHSSRSIRQQASSAISLSLRADRN